MALNDTMALTLATKAFTDERAVLLKLPPIWSWIILLCNMASLGIGWMAKHYIYQHIFRTKVKEQPINIFILVNQVNNHICGTITLLSISLSLAFGESIKELAEVLLGHFISGNTYCWIFYNSLNFNIIYSGVDGIGTAVIRLLYIKKGTWIKFKFGEFKLLILVGLVVGFVTGVSIYWYSIENISTRSMYNTCFGHNNNFQEVVLDYIQAGTNIPFKTEKLFWLPLSGVIAVIIALVEFLSYTYIFIYLYQRDDTLSILSEEAKKSRKKFNSQTMTGQFYLFITECLYTMFILIAFAAGTKFVAPETKDLITLVKVVDFGMLSLVHCLLIPDLRVRFFAHIERTLERGSTVYNCKCAKTD